MLFVSIIIPCYNEERTIRLLLEAIYHQTYPLSQLEVIIADGLSTDRTREEIYNFQRKFSELSIRIVDNPKRIIPSALNIALSEAKGDIIVRLDAHSQPQSDYVERCVVDLSGGLGDNVGGVWDIHPGDSGWMAQSIAAAAAHPLAVGDALYRYTDQSGEVDTVPFGAFYKKLVERVGLFNEGLLTNEDYEFNTRIKLAGGKVWIDPAIRAVYFARSNLASLRQQYFRYGYWKFQMLRKYPKSIRWRQALPPLFILSLVGLAVISIFRPVASSLLLLELLIYGLILIAVSYPVARRLGNLRLLLGIPLAIATMHLSWGVGFLFSVIGPNQP